MPTDLLPLLGALAFFVIGLLFGTIALPWLRRSRRPAAPEDRFETGGGRSTLEYECAQCGRPVVDSVKALRPLEGAEVALVIRDRPGMLGRPMAEHVCPYCAAAHCFLTDKRNPIWIGMNFSVPQGKGRRCLECNKKVAVPPWPPGEWDGRVREAPNVSGDLGLVCSRCGGLVCVGCCERYTRTRANEGVFLCPRCTRGPVDVFFHP